LPQKPAKSATFGANGDSAPKVGKVYNYYRLCWQEDRVMGKPTRDNMPNWKQHLVSLWDWFADIILEPFLFAFAVFMLFSRIQSFLDYTTTHPQYSFWEILELDMEANTLIYVIFCIVVALWMLSKGIKYRRERRNQQRLNSTLEKIHTKLGEIETTLKNLAGSVGHTKHYPERKPKQGKKRAKSRRRSLYE
jgi:hypothetical protein